MQSITFKTSLLGLGGVVAVVAAACSADPESTGFTGGAGTTGAGAGTATSTGSTIFETTSSGSTGTGILTTEPNCDGIDPATDHDADGWTGNEGDCNNCTDQMNPGAADYPGNNIDENCNQAPDDDFLECDAALGLEGNDPMDGARAMGLCRVSDGTGWGVTSAQWVRSDGQPITDPLLATGYGILSGFGPNVNPQEGNKVLAISSGAARQPSDSGYASPGGHWKDFYPHGSPPGYPKESPACPGVTTGEPYDSAGLRLTIKTPTNAKSLSFKLNFYTYEFPNYICSTYNDFFVAMLNPILAGSTDGNISYDSQGNTISVNAGFLQVCQAQTASSGAFFPCELGTAELSGTGFDDGGPQNSAATSWLQTTAPVENPGGEITLHFAIWDSGDGVLDSTTLLDDFKFEVVPANTETVPIENPE